MSDRQRRLVTAFTGRSTLVAFAALAVGWFLPELVPELAPLLSPLFLPAYLITMVVYDGGLLEQVVYAAEGTLPVGGRLLYDVGQALTFYVFTVAAALVGGVVARRYGPERADDPGDGAYLRYVVAGGLLLLGVGLVAQGIVTQPMMTSVSCEGSASAAGNATATATPDCTRTTEPATGAQRYIVGRGLATGMLGGVVVAVDRWFAGRQ
jgi:hypothetical protein